MRINDLRRLVSNSGAQEADIKLRQSNARVGKTADAQSGRYAQAQQWRCTRREPKALRSWLGRVIREVQGRTAAFGGVLKTRMETAQRLHAQQRDFKNMLYALNAGEVTGIAKSKARTPYEFGVKTSVAVLAEEGVVVGMRSTPGSPYDGHTLHRPLEQVETLSGVKPCMALADQGFRGVQPPQGTRLLLSHTRGLPPALKKLLKSHEVIEPTIGQMKTNGQLARNWLKGRDGDAIHAVLCGAGHNLRLILAHLRELLLALIALMVLGRIRGASPRPTLNTAA